MMTTARSTATATTRITTALEETAGSMNENIRILQAKDVSGTHHA